MFDSKRKCRWFEMVVNSFSTELPFSEESKLPKEVINELKKYGSIDGTIGESSFHEKGTVTTHLISSKAFKNIKDGDLIRVTEICVVPKSQKIWIPISSKCEVWNDDIDAWDLAHERGSEIWDEAVKKSINQKKNADK